MPFSLAFDHVMCGQMEKSVLRYNLIIQLCRCFLYSGREEDGSVWILMFVSNQTEYPVDCKNENIR